MQNAKLADDHRRDTAAGVSVGAAGLARRSLVPLFFAQRAAPIKPSKTAWLLGGW